MAKAKIKKIPTPKGVFAYPFLERPDTKFDDEGRYKCDLIVDPSEPGVQEWLDKVEAVAQKTFDEAKKKSKPAAAKKLTMHLPFEDVVDDDGNETGKVKIRTSCKAVVHTQSGDTFENKPALFGADNKPLTGKLGIGGGTVGRLSVQLIPYSNAAAKDAGVSLRLKGAQILELVQFGGDGGSYGFGDEGEGFSADDVADDEEDEGFEDETGGEESEEDDF